jgi:hypothetical protein
MGKGEMSASSNNFTGSPDQRRSQNLPKPPKRTLWDDRVSPHKTKRNLTLGDFGPASADWAGSEIFRLLPIGIAGALN